VPISRGVSLVRLNQRDFAAAPCAHKKFLTTAPDGSNFCTNRNDGNNNPNEVAL
jgi:hypothetical protein